MHASEPITMPFVLVTEKRLAFYGGAGADSRNTVGKGSFATQTLAPKSVLYGFAEEVNFIERLWDRGLQVRVGDTQRAYDMGPGSENRPLYYINCSDPIRFHSRYPQWKRSNCKWVREGPYLALRITHLVKAGEQLLLPKYMEL
jgi:hypothetical protein